MSKEITSIREALLHEALKDIDALIEKVVTIDAGLSQKIEASTREALNRAHHAAHANFKAMIEEREKAWLVDSQRVAALIGAQMNTAVARFITVNESLTAKVWRLIFWQIGLAILSGAIGGLIVAKSMI